MSFVERHLGPNEKSIGAMLSLLKCRDLDDLVGRSLPQNLRLPRPLDLPSPLSERELLNLATKRASENQLLASYFGMGYYRSFTPPVIQRNVLENPGWYTAYTPYQAEISQGRMEALFNFQTMVCELTGLPLANASLLDEGTAAAEAMQMAWHAQKNSELKGAYVHENVFSQTLSVLKTRSKALNLRLHSGTDWPTSLFCAVIQYPAADGSLPDLEKFIGICKSKGLKSIVIADPMALCLLKPPGELGADIVVGSTQRFGIPMAYGGPHAAFLATTEEFKRLIPGRIIGLSKDSKNRPALRLALQTREQHIRREKATSNICTAQVLLAVMAAMYAVYHGPEGLKNIAWRIHLLASSLRKALEKLGLRSLNSEFFDTLSFKHPKARNLHEELLKARIGIFFDGSEGLKISLDECSELSEIEKILEVIAKTLGQRGAAFEWLEDGVIPKGLLREGPCLKHPIFSKIRSETEMLRYIFSLQEKDLALNRSMIPLGSCTMKLNASAEMLPISLPGFAQIHPLAPPECTLGYKALIQDLKNGLCEVTGFSEVSLQPNSGAQGEYAGLLTIRAYHESRGEGARDICLIPTSAHGTNPASAAMAGLKVIPVNCDSHGNVDLADLKSKAATHSKNLAALMITYPSTHGVFESTIKEICQVVHESGGQVYMDGANLNALVGIAHPGDFGADVAHLNLHKTFCIPHGGGGPGVGPIGVKKHLAPFLPGNPFRGEHAVASAPHGSAGILPISWAYMAMMGSEGLKKATQVAILNANYIAHRLKSHFPVLYTGPGGFVAHECIIDLRPFKDTAGVTADDVAKRLMDYGFHAPTMSWPVAGTLMIEPTESESQAEMDRFCEAMISIREEIREIETGGVDREQNVLKWAPHPLEDVVNSEWARPYSREKAAFPLAWVRQNKYWPQVSRIDNAFGDKNLVCTCQ